MGRDLHGMLSIALGALLLVGGCTVTDASDSAAANAGAAASREPAAQPGASATPGATTAGTPGAAGAAGGGLSPDSVSVAPSTKASDTLPVARMRLEVDVAARQLHVYDGDARTASHPVAVGSAEWPTRTGQWHVTQVVFNPEWIPPDESWAEQRTPKKPGAADNPLGRAQLIYDPPRTIHGTNDAASIGKPVSHGSIRLSNDVIVRLARQVMEATGEQKDEAWYRRAQTNRTEKVVVDLKQRVPIRVF